MVYTDELKRKMVGLMIEKLLQNTHPAEIEENKYAFPEDDRANKMYLYGAHDFNVATFIRAHNLKDVKDRKLPLVPDYVSALIFEHLKDENNKSFIQVSIKV